MIKLKYIINEESLKEISNQTLFSALEKATKLRKLAQIKRFSDIIIQKYFNGAEFKIMKINSNQVIEKPDFITRTLDKWAGNLEKYEKYILIECTPKEVEIYEEKDIRYKIIDIECFYSPKSRAKTLFESFQMRYYSKRDTVNIGTNNMDEYLINRASAIRIIKLIKDFNPESKLTVNSFKLIENEVAQGDNK